MATDFAALEEADGVRMAWNIWPNSKLEATKCVIPFGVMYTPNKRLPQMPASDRVFAICGRNPESAPALAG